MKYKIKAVVSGSIGRPFYEGHTTVTTSDPNPDFQDLVYRKLKRTSFPEIWRDEIKIKQIEVIQ